MSNHVPELTLGERLRVARARTGMTTHEVATLTGVSASSVSRWERGTSEPPFADVVALAHLYNVDLDWFASSAGVTERYLDTYQGELDLREPVAA